MSSLISWRLWRLNIDIDLCAQHRELILQHIDEFAAKTAAIFQQSDFPEVSDPDGQLYSGGFFSRDDNQRMDTIRNTPVSELAALHFNFDDPRLETMLFRYRARNFPETLSKEDKKQWDDYRQDKFSNPATSHRTMNQLLSEIDSIRQASDTIGSQLAVLEDLVEYANSIIIWYKSNNNYNKNN